MPARYLNGGGLMMMLDSETKTATRSLRRGIAKLGLSSALLLSMVAAASAQAQPPKTHLKVGDPAPDFTLIDTKRQPVKLSDFKGKKGVVLAFYVLAFTGG
jgi:peroxiredoxin Q/BCP